MESEGNNGGRTLVLLAACCCNGQSEEGQGDRKEQSRMKGGTGFGGHGVASGLRDVEVGLGVVW